MEFESIGQYHDAWSGIVLYAPDGFTSLDGDALPDQKAALDAAFEEIYSGFHFVEKKIKDQRLLRVLRELLLMSHEAYHAGDTKRGAHIFQECEGLIWPSRKGKLKYVVEAEQRALGDVELFKDVVVSPYPYEGSMADLGPHQVSLFQFAQSEAKRYFDEKASFQSLTWILEAQGAITQVKERSQKALRERLKKSTEAGQVIATVTARFPFGGWKGILAFDLEQADYPRAEVISLVENWVIASPRVHLHEPEIFISKQ